MGETKVVELFAAVAVPAVPVTIEGSTIEGETDCEDAFALLEEDAELAFE